jgi:hypothetical protein
MVSVQYVRLAMVTVQYVRLAMVTVQYVRFYTLSPMDFVVSLSSIWIKTLANYKLSTCVISGSRRDVHEISILLGYYAA